MMAGRSFGTKLAAGYGLSVLLTVITTATSVGALTYVLTGNNRSIEAATVQLSGARQVETTAESRISDYRAYLLTGQPEYLTATTQDRENLLAQIGTLRQKLTDATERRLLDAVTTTEATLAASLQPLLDQRKTITDLRTVKQLLTGHVKADRQAMQGATAALVARVSTVVEQERRHSQSRTEQAILAIIGLGVIAAITGLWIAVRLTRDLRREVGTAVGHIQSSSAQLEAAAAQQATGVRDQASAMSEITTTISELLITSRQIAESAQRVSQIAEDTADAARSGDSTIEQTRASIAAIRRQVDQIVQHMLALGEKSQQIGGVVELVSELAEQTNILAINATIEASGAGEWGRRFAVVAEEIRKLADRTAGSAKEIRTLIEDVRGAVNTTVMATEIGAKAVDAGSRQFDDATNSFRRIGQLVSTTNDATREIELSTKQQSTAVEQVNMAASDTARVTRETEASAVQTRQTASHLSTLSGDLLELVGTGRH
jgi:methyl-accepting chemotaxis protein